MLIYRIQKNLVRRKIAFFGSSIEDSPISLVIEVVVEKFFFSQTLEKLVLPKHFSSQSVWLMHFENKHYVGQLLVASLNSIELAGLFLVCHKPIGTKICLKKEDGLEIEGQLEFFGVNCRFERYYPRKLLPHEKLD